MKRSPAPTGQRAAARDAIEIGLLHLVCLHGCNLPRQESFRGIGVVGLSRHAVGSGGQGSKYLARPSAQTTKVRHVDTADWQTNRHALEVLRAAYELVGKGG